MSKSYLAILIIMVVSVATGVIIVALSHFLSPFRPTPTKTAAYESGMTPITDARERFSVKFYLVAILFIVFDIETIFLIPWGVQFRDLGLFGFVEMLVFMGVLLVGYLYIWKKGALQWD